MYQPKCNFKLFFSQGFMNEFEIQPEEFLINNERHSPNEFHDIGKICDFPFYLFFKIVAMKLNIKCLLVYSYIY